MDWGYVSGYFDGEGYVGIYKKSGPRIAWCNTDRASLEAIQAFIGVGMIRTSDRTDDRTLGTKAMYYLTVQRVAELRSVLPAMIEHCLIKRARLEELLLAIQDRPSRYETYGRLNGVGAERIRQLYWDDGLCPRQIAEIVGGSAGGVAAFMRRNGIAKRSKSDSMLNQYARGRNRDVPARLLGGVDPTVVRSLYWTDGLSVRQIADQFGVTRSGMRGFMTRHAITMRPRGTQRHSAA